MDDLKLCDANGNVVYSVSRKGNLDYTKLTSQVVDAAIRFDWLDKIPKETKVINNLYFRENYMAGCAKQLWEYHLKHADNVS